MKKQRNDLSQEILHELIDCDPITGIMVWKERGAKWFKQNEEKPEYNPERRQKSWNKTYAGKEAFTNRCNKGYRIGSILGKNYKRGRIVFVYFHGYWPDQIDHENGIKDDDRLSNLRDVSNVENCKNQTRRKNNTSGVQGVSWHKHRRKWQVRVVVNGKETYCGIYESFEEAVKVRLEKAKENGYHKNHGREKFYENNLPVLAASYLTTLPNSAINRELYSANANTIST